MEPAVTEDRNGDTKSGDGNEDEVRLPRSRIEDSVPLVICKHVDAANQKQSSSEIDG
jgi:hypothetical protein